MALYEGKGELFAVSGSAQTQKRTVAPRSAEEIRACVDEEEKEWGEEVVDADASGVRSDERRLESIV